MRVRPGKVTKTNSWSGLARDSSCVFLSTLYTSCFENFFSSSILGEKHPQQVFTVLPGVKKLKILSLISNLSFLGFLTHHQCYDDPGKAFSCLLLSLPSVQLEDSNLFSHLGTSLPIMK